MIIILLLGDVIIPKGAHRWGTAADDNICSEQKKRGNMSRIGAGAPTYPRCSVMWFTSSDLWRGLG